MYKYICIYIYKSTARLKLVGKICVFTSYSPLQLFKMYTYIYIYIYIYKYIYI